jgi:hypothetical protein
MTKHLISVFGILLLLLCGFATFNFIVDPLLLYQQAQGDEQTLNRINQFDKMRFSKPYHVKQIKPDAVIIGSSRSGTIRPHHRAWQGLTTYNLSIPGITLYEMNRTVRHAHTTHALKKLMIGLDYQALVSPRPKSRPGFAASRLAQAPEDKYSPALLKQELRDLQASLFSFDIMGDGLTALSPPGPRVMRYFTDGAWMTITNQLTGRGGYIFAAKNALYTRKVTGFEADTNLAIFTDLLRFCYQNDIETRLFFTPTHVFFVDIWHYLGTEQLWRDTHKEVLEINVRLAGEYNKTAFTIRGFGNEQGVTDEPIYLARNIDRAWFNDGVHYRARLATGMMNGVWDPASDFGQLLTTGNIDDYLDSVDQMRRSFLQAHEEVVEMLHQKIGLDR